MLARVLLLIVLLAACGGTPTEIPTTPRAMPTTTPTEEPLPTRTPRPLPTATHTPAPRELWIANTQGQGAVLRAQPGAGERVVGLAEGTRVAPQGEEQDLEGRRWLRVQEPLSGRFGWVAAELLVPTPPTSRLTPVPRAPASTPTRPR